MHTTAATVCIACMWLSGQALADEKLLGKRVYDQICYKCHRGGILGAPTAGNKQAWTPRLTNGIGSLYKSALNGKNDMPPRGGKEELTDTEVTAAVDYLLGLSGFQAGAGSVSTGGSTAK